LWYNIMPHFYCHPENITNQKEFKLSPEESRHAAKVLRKIEGDEISLFDGKGNSFRGKITSTAGVVSGVIVSSADDKSPSSRPPVKLCFYQAVPKKYKFEDIIDKLSQLGVSKIIPVITERTIVRLSADDASRKLVRWRAAALAASKQCGRPDIPEVLPPAQFADALSAAAASGFPAIIAWEAEKQNAKKTIREVLSPSPAGLNIFIGPEGGFSVREIELAFAILASAKTIGLGPRILRADTAAEAVAAILGYEISVDDPR